MAYPCTLPKSSTIDTAAVTIAIIVIRVAIITKFIIAPAIT